MRNSKVKDLKETKTEVLTDSNNQQFIYIKFVLRSA